MKPYRPPSDSNPVRDKFATARKELSSSLIERDEEVDLVLTALLANEHVLLVGPPGCGKSLLLDAVMNWMSARKFSILLTKFTCVEEVMGPISLATTTTRRAADFFHPSRLSLSASASTFRRHSPPVRLPLWSRTNSANTQQ